MYGDPVQLAGSCRFAGFSIGLRGRRGSLVLKPYIRCFAGQFLGNGITDERL